MVVCMAVRRPPLTMHALHARPQVLLVHDKETDKAACAMDVNVGSLFDGDVEGAFAPPSFHRRRSCQLLAIYLPHDA